MGCVAADPLFAQNSRLCAQIAADIKRHAEDGAHSRPYYLGIKQVDRSPAHQDPCCAGRLRCPEDRAQISRVLNILQDQEQGNSILRSQQHFAAVDRHPGKAQDSLRRCGVRCLCHHLFRDNRQRVLPQKPLFPLRCVSDLIFGRVDFFDILRRCIRAEPCALDHEQTCLPAQLSFFLQFDQSSDPRI